MCTLNEFVADFMLDEELINAVSNAEFLPAGEVDQLLATLDGFKHQPDEDLTSIFGRRLYETSSKHAEYLNTFDVSYLDEHEPSSSKQPEVSQTRQDSKPTLTFDELVNVLISPVSLPETSSPTPVPEPEPKPAPSLSKKRKLEVLENHVFHLPDSKFRTSEEIRIKYCSIEKRPRITFTEEQVDIMSYHFGKNEYLSKSQQKELAKILDIEERRIKIWFQNQRNKRKRLMKTKTK